LERLFKVLRRAVVLDCYANKPTREALEEIVEPLEAMIEETVEYALEHGTPGRHCTRFSTRGIGISILRCQRGLLRDPIEMLLEGPGL
jgi:hypothetical protein